MKILLIVLLLGSSAFAQNTRVPDFNNAKKILKKLNYLGVQKEIYCGCVITNSDKGLFDNKACGYIPKKDNTRAKRLEAEHVVPFENIVGHTEAWDYGVVGCGGKKGRACASKVYGEIEGDLWNLLPSIGELNGLRSNYAPAEIVGESRQFGKCDFEVESRKVEPPQEIKPLYVVTYQYMQKAYGAKVRVNLIAGKNEKLFEAWGKIPFSPWICQWGKRVVSVQGNENQFLIEKCKKEGKW